MTKESSNSLISLDRWGREQSPNSRTGNIQHQILKGLCEVERDGIQSFFDIWCEARLENGQIIWCWPQYRGTEGSRYDWALIEFESEVDVTSNEDNDSGDGRATMTYPGKVLALYEDSAGNMKALVHSVEYKTARSVEGPFGDS